MPRLADSGANPLAGTYTCPDAKADSGADANANSNTDSDVVRDVHGRAGQPGDGGNRT